VKKELLHTWVPFILCAFIFIFIKLTGMGVRLSDTNIYFLTAEGILSGKVLYKDIFFTNFPIIPYMASFYFLISGGNLLFYYFTAVIEIIITSGFIYYLSFKESSSRLVASSALTLYLYSFMILSTSSHQSGVFLAALFGVLSYFFFKRNNFYLIGMFTALALLTKAYSIPLLFSYLILFSLCNRKALLKFTLGGIITATIVMVPTILFAAKPFFQDVFMYSLTRTEGVSKLGILYFIIQHDFLFICLLVSCLAFFRKQLFFGLFAVSSIIFFFYYKDVYYLYLNVTLPIIVLSFPPINRRISEVTVLNRFMIPTIILIFTCYNFFSYFNGYDNLQIIPIKQIVNLLRENKIKKIYGVNGISPAISYQARIPLLNNVIDTNDNIFRKGYLNASSITSDAVQKHSAIITVGAWYPELGIKQDIMTEIVDQKQMKKNCHLLKRFPFHSEGVINSINVFSC